MTTKTKTSKTERSADKIHTCTCLTIVDETDDVIYVDTCGGDTKRRFCPGHDARTKGTLQRAFRSGKAIATGDSWVHEAVDQTPTDPMAVAGHYGYERFLTEAPVRKSRKAQGPMMVKFGRWEYEAVAVDELDDGTFETTYIDKKGDTARKVTKSDPRV